MKVVFSHPTGNEFVRAALKGLNDAHALQAFHTAIACFEGSALDKLAGIGPLSELRRRSFDKSLQPLTHMWPLKETGRLVADKLGMRNIITHETGMFSVDAVYRYNDKKTAASLKRGIDAVYAYEDGALLSFARAKQLDIKCLYDLPIGYWRAARRLMQNALDTRPEWAPTLTAFKDSVAKLSNKDEELRLADRIFVASSFTANTLKEYQGGQLAPVHVVPYAFPDVGAARDYNTSGRGPLKLLFVGGLSQRKGIADLFEAVDRIGNRVELTVVGRKTCDVCPALDAALARHRWIETMPHAQVLKTMREHDVLVFPSLFEGFGLVITEAMAQGTPVITTDRTAGPDVMTHGHDGWFTPAESVNELQTSIENLLVKPELIAKAGKAAIETARKRTWQVYSKELAEIIMNIK
ncbi:glycosyl transferase family 1 [Mucilaginibacter yixingensis]|uniref:Glycosyl transferase family 1 n=1 Tax=Mucilaginibacter yixingensis TaxID=1295612 RepID=A0A2T5JC62_9SPHI|nr:glycosyltransferase family 4 protein [Mucilaginibacter yixingensis]PTQ99351.1 glycosyl transferase family 1 [Mucilaginibacter yixingensis]